MTPLEMHVDSWKDCTRCVLHETRRKVAIYRGTVHCDIAFIGEAPGRTEDMWGYPFAGRAGNLLNEIIAATVPTDLECAFSNLVGCLPLRVGDKWEPTDECVKACQPRLVEFLGLAKPRLIVTVGKISAQWFVQGPRENVKTTVPQVNIVHPAYILRCHTAAERSLLIRKCEIALRDTISELFLSNGA